jgi:hypothetical protein
MVMRKEYWTIQIFYDKKPKSGHYLELEYNKKQDALRELSEYRSLGFKAKLNTCTDLPLFFRDPRDEQPEEKEIIIIPNKRGRKAKYL